jgi:protein-S-isoprenylcysteine O-methyltransferase Ste14
MKLFVPLTLVVICLAGMILLGHYWPVVEFLHAPWTYLGTAAVLAGLYFCGAGALWLRKKRTTLEPFDEPARMVTSGVYRYTRNPIYLGFATALVGVWILLGALSAGLPVLVFIVVTDHGYIRFEEKVLARKFGREYEEYRRKTRRWI